MQAWSNGLPTNPFDVSGEGDCALVVIDEVPRPMTLRSTDCDLHLPYVCELSACPRGWTSYAGSCYQYLAQPSSWSEAESLCQSFAVDEVKGHLVSIATNEENE